MNAVQVRILKSMILHTPLSGQDIRERVNLQKGKYVVPTIIYTELDELCELGIIDATMKAGNRYVQFYTLTEKGKKELEIRRGVERNTH